MTSYVPLASRFLLSAIFIFSGLGKIAAPEATQQYMAAFGLPLTGLLLFGAIVIELGAGLLLLAGYQTRLAAIALAVFVVPATVIFHTAFSDQTQMIMFMKNLALLGGLFMVAGYGPGAISVDERAGRSQPVVLRSNAA